MEKLFKFSKIVVCKNDSKVSKSCKNLNIKQIYNRKKKKNNQKFFLLEALFFERLKDT